MSEHSTLLLCPCPKCGRARYSNKHHYKRNLRTPCQQCAGQARTRPLTERFWEKVNKNGPVPPHRPELGPCWIWTGSLDAKDYGFVHLGKGHKMARTSRVAFFLAHGRWPYPMALHHCDNPPCVRADHLFEGDAIDNGRDASEKGRIPVGIRSGRARLTNEMVACIRADNRSHADVAKEFGVSATTIHAIRQRITWRHLP
jgi:uncharacterized protein YerC